MRIEKRLERNDKPIPGMAQRAATGNPVICVECESFAMLAASILLLCFALAVRLLLGWYCSSKLGIARVRLRDQILRAGQVLAGLSQ